MLSSDVKTNTVDAPEEIDGPLESGPKGCNVFETPITVQWDCDGETVSTSGMLQDLSNKGIRLVLQKPIPLRKTIEFKICAVGMEFDCNVAAEVCWMRARGPDQWLLGCSFTSEFSDNALDQLAVSGYVNRRKDPRCPVSIAALARQELMTEAIGVRLEDYSRGGCRVFSPIPMSVGERVMVILAGTNDATYSLAARALWQLKVQDGFFVGCCFLDNSSFGQLAQVVRQQDSSAVSDLVPPEDSRPLGLASQLSSFFASKMRHLTGGSS